MTFSVLIVGCGMIAGGYDEQNGNADEVLSHAGAYRRHTAFRIIACVEPDHARRAAFMAYWKIERGFATLDDALAASLAFDVVSLCTPTASHVALLEQLLAGPQRLVFCEKPLTEDVARAESLMQRYAAAGKMIAVDYMRRWDSKLVELAERLNAGDFGALQFAVAHYTKGVMHNGGHLIDLLHMLLGPLVVGRALRAQESPDSLDPAVDAVLQSESGAPVYLVAADWRSFELFEIQIVTEGARIIIGNSGFTLAIQPRVEDARYPGYFGLADASPVPTGLSHALLAAVDNIAEVLSGRGRLASDAASALAAQRICADLRDRALQLSKSG